MKNLVRSLAAWRPLLLRSEINRMLILSTLFSGFLVLLRFIYVKESNFFFLIWNLFLAWIPYFISSFLEHKLSWVENKLKLAIAFMAWLVFVPNTFYIITDFFHLGFCAGAPLWYDLTLIISFAWNGLLLGVLSIRQMEKIAAIFLSNKTTAIFLYPVMLLNGLGVYIGRYLRFNSWDIITNPFELTADIIRMLIHPLAYSEAWAMVIIFSAFMILVYTSLKSISKFIWT